MKGKEREKKIHERRTNRYGAYVSSLDNLLDRKSFRCCLCFLWIEAFDNASGAVVEYSSKKSTAAIGWKKFTQSEESPAVQVVSWTEILLYLFQIQTFTQKQLLE